MGYFNKEFISFFKSLAVNNKTEWFHENKKVYEKEVKKPFQELVGEMIARIQKFEGEIDLKPSDAIMRINRDIRFSKDKMPYNLYVGANISRYGKKDKSYPGFYFQLSPEGVKIYGGIYMAEPARLEKIRQFISANPKELRRAVEDKEFMSGFGEILGEKAKRLSPDLKEPADKEPLISKKQFYYQASLPATAITSPDLADQLMEYYRAALPVQEFLKKAWQGEKSNG